jgi:hypothetical protein
MKAFSVGAGVLVALTGCSGASNQGDENPGPGTGSFPQFPPPGGGFPGGGFPGGGFPPQGGYPQGGGAGYVNPTPGGGTAGVINPWPGQGGSYNPPPGGGGTYNPPPGGGGSINPPPQGGAGGVIDPGGNGGGVNPGGAGGGVQLVSCDQRTETSTNPIRQPCGNLTTVLGKQIQLGPYGAQMDDNVGTGFENPDPADSASCVGFAAIFGEDPKQTQQLLDVGPQPCNASNGTGNCLNFKLYSTYHPANWPAEKIPVISWGNGTCAQPEGYGPLLRYVASYGFFIVAANSRQVGSGAPITKGLDFAAAANADPNSPYYNRLDMSRVGVMGHSQGSSGAAIAASDSRVKGVILWNGGQSSAKPFLAVSGDLDIGGATAASMRSAVNAAAKGAFLYYHNPVGMGSLKGHLVLMLSPERVIEPGAGFWQMLFNNDANARNLFVGTSCGLCNHQTDYDFGQKGF